MLFICVINSQDKESSYRCSRNKAKPRVRQLTLEVIKIIFIQNVHIFIWAQQNSFQRDNVRGMSDKKQKFLYWT